MDIYEWIAITVFAAIYGVPFGVGLCVASWTRAALLALASFTGIYLSVWSTLGPLFLPLAAELVTRFELTAFLTLSFIAGGVQAVLMATLGFATKKLLAWSVQRPAGHQT
jgi:hypothetical protein